MIEHLVTALANRYVNKETIISLEIKGLVFEDLQTVETRLKNTHLVGNVFIRSFRDGRAHLDVSTLLTTSQLANEIQAVDWAGLHLEVIGVSGNSIEAVKLHAVAR